MKKTKRNQISVIYIAAMVMALVLSACAGEPTSAPTQTPPADEGPTQVPTTVGESTQAPLPGATPDPNLPVAVIPTPAPGEPAAIANYNTTIYGGPGDNYVVYSAFLGGQIAKVVGKSEDSLWWAVSVPVAPTGSGWVDASLVTATSAESVPVLPAPPVPPTTEFIPPGPNDPQIMAIANADVRSGPGTNYPAYGIAMAGTAGWVIGKSEDGQYWVVRVNPEIVGTGYGWVNIQYTQASNVDEVQTIQNPEAAATVPESAPPSGVPVATAADYVNVRTGPGTNYSVLGVAAPGASAEVSGKSSDSAWWQINISTQYTASGLGWVSASYVTTQNTENVPVVDAAAAPPALETTPPAALPGCALTAQDPSDGTDFSAGANFITSWDLQNTGVGNWNSGEYKTVFAGAVANVPLHQGTDLYDLSNTVEPGATYNFSVPMIAPFNSGVYGELWQVVLGNQPVCQFYVYIQVQ